MRGRNGPLDLAIVVFLASFWAAGCAGGGGASTPGEAQGAYRGTTSGGVSFGFGSLILPTDKVYLFYDMGRFYNCGLVVGQGLSDHGKFNAATVTDFNACSLTGPGTGLPVILSGTLEATYVKGSSISGTITDVGGFTKTFTGTAAPPSVFNYNTPPAISDITGTWTGTLSDGTGATVSIAADGSFTGSDSSGCAFSGKLTADSSGKNFFQVLLTYSSGCQFPNQQANGIAFYTLHSSSTGGPQLLVATTIGNSSGAIFNAEK